MVNTDIQGVVPLSGAGFIAHRNGDFRPGEFKRLTNVEIQNEALVNRRAVKHVAGTSAGAFVNPMSNCLGFMGNFGVYTILASSSEQIAIGPGDKVTMWDPSLLTVPAEGGSFHRIIGYFRYIKRNYWITLEFRAGIHVKIKLFHGDASIDNDIPETYDDAYFATLTETDIYELLVTDVSFNDFKFNNFLIQGNRLWLFTSLGVYFSKATDPTVFAVPDGGFFKFPDQVINHGCSLKDVIYVLCDNTIHTINYTTDPNLDSFVTQISDNMGGESSTVHKDAVYVINQVGVYRILNNSIDKVVDNEFDVGLDYYRNSITSFEDYLVVNKYNDINYEKFSSGNSTGRVNLFTNPSVETGLTGFNATDTFMTRERIDLNPAVGDFSPFTGTDYAIKCTKTNDTSVAAYTNLYTNPSFEVDTYGHTAHSWVTLSAEDYTGATPDEGVGTKRLRADVDVPLNSTNPNTIVERTVVESDYYPFSINDIFTLSWSHYIDPDIADNEGEMVFRVYAYDADFNLIPGVSFYGPQPDYIYENPLLTPTAQWHRQHTKYWFTSIFIDYSILAYVKFKWVLKTKRKAAEIWQFYLDKVSLFGDLNSTQYEEITGPDYIPYFDGDTADVPSLYNYGWSGTPHASTSVQQGTPGTYDEQRSLIRFTDNITVEPSKTYTIGAAIASPLADRDFQVYVHHYDSLGAFAYTGVFDLGSTIDVGEWAYLETDITISSYVTSIELEFRTTDPMGDLDYVYLDAFIVELASTYQGYFDGSFVDTSAAVYAWSGVAHASTSTVAVSNLPRALYEAGKFFDPFQQSNSLGYNTYFLNMDNGSVHVMDFRDALDLNEGVRGRIAEIYVNPNKDSSGNYNLFFYTARETADTDAGYTFTNNFYYLSSFRDINFTDWAVTSLGELQKYPPKVEIEIDSYAPDGSEYLFKKFRHLLMMAKLPTSDFKVQFGFDNEDYTGDVSLNSMVTPNRPPSPYRIRVNQRCKSISIFFFNTEYNVPLEVEGNYDVLEISDLRTLWTYSGKAIEKSTL